jgi:hypothetical protein
MRRSIPILAAALLSMSALANAGEDKATDIATAASKPAEPKGGDCVFARNIDNWNALDDETLLIYAPTRHQPYLLKLWTPVFGLKSEFSIGVQDADNDGQLCDYGRDSIIVRSPAGHPERYKVRTLTRIDEAQAQAMLDSSKQKKNKGGEPAATLPAQSDVKSDKPK